MNKETNKTQRVSFSELSQMISGSNHTNSPTGSYKEIAANVRKQYKVQVNSEDVAKCYIPQICIDEAEILYSRYGY